MCVSVLVFEFDNQNRHFRFFFLFFYFCLNANSFNKSEHQKIVIRKLLCLFHPQILFDLLFRSSDIKQKQCTPETLESNKNKCIKQNNKKIKLESKKSAFVMCHTVVEQGMRVQLIDFAHYFSVLSFFRIQQKKIDFFYEKKVCHCYQLNLFI